jgi:hypothetical protein
MQDSNEWLAAAYEDLDTADQQIAMMKIRLDIQSKQISRIPASFAFGAIGFGIGTPLIIEGLQSDNQAMLYSGAITIGVSAAVWAFGHYFFLWW